MYILRKQLMQFSTKARIQWISNTLSRDIAHSGDLIVRRPNERARYVTCVERVIGVLKGSIYHDRI